MIRGLIRFLHGLFVAPFFIAFMVIVLLPLQLAYQAGLDSEHMLEHGCSNNEKLGWFGKVFLFLTTLGYSQVRKDQIP